MIFNLAELRKSKMLDGAADLYEARKNEIILQDQDLLNIMFCNQTYILPIKWNINNGMFGYYTCVRHTPSMTREKEC